MRVAVIGRTHLLLEAARRVAEEGHSIVLVATAAPAPEYRAGEEDFATLARQHGAPFFNAPAVNSAEFVAELCRAQADIGISMNWPVLIRHDACESLRHGILNAHAGDLPRYRGNACPNWAILNGEQRIGLCVHAMDPDALDAGPIYARDYLALTDETYISDVYDWIEASVPDLFLRALANMAEVNFSPEDQRASGVRPLRCFPRRPEDSLIDWRQEAVAISRLVRASSRPFSGAFTYLDGRERVVIWRARPATIDQDIVAVPGQIVGRGGKGGILVACGVGILEIEEATRASGKPLPSHSAHRLGSAGTA